MQHQNNDYTSLDTFTTMKNVLYYSLKNGITDYYRTLTSSRMKKVWFCFICTFDIAIKVRESTLFELRQTALILLIIKKDRTSHSVFDLYLVRFRFATATALVTCQLLFCRCRWIHNVSCFVDCFMMNCTCLNFYWLLCCTTTFTI